MATVVLYTDPEVFAIDERLRAAYMPLLEEKRLWAAESSRVCAELSAAQMEIEALRYKRRVVCPRSYGRAQGCLGPVLR